MQKLRKRLRTVRWRQYWRADACANWQCWRRQSSTTFFI